MILFLIFSSHMFSFNLFARKKIALTKCSVYFNEDSFELNQEYENSLLQFIEAFKKQKQINARSLFAIKGYDQYSDDSNAKKRIIEKRIESVKNFLINNGLEEEDCRIVNNYEKTLDMFNDQEIDDENRVVKLYIKFADLSLLINKKNSN